MLTRRSQTHVAAAPRRVTDHCFLDEKALRRLAIRLKTKGHIKPGETFHIGAPVPRGRQLQRDPRAICPATKLGHHPASTPATGLQGQQLTDGNVLRSEKQLELDLVQQSGPCHEVIEKQVARKPAEHAPRAAATGLLDPFVGNHQPQMGRRHSHSLSRRSERTAGLSALARVSRAGTRFCAKVPSGEVTEVSPSSRKQRGRIGLSLRAKSSVAH